MLTHTNEYKRQEGKKMLAYIRTSLNDNVNPVTDTKSRKASLFIRNLSD